MGEVYLAEDTKLTRKVALKILPPDVSGERKRLNRFLQEARLAANLNHPHICTIYEIDADGETPFLAMELVEGETLAEKIIRAGSFDLHEILEIASQITDALDEAHRARIIHRDIKSSNVILNRRGQVKVLDFGLAKIISEEVSEQDVTRAKTEDGMLVGTVQYMSPEHALGKKLDGRTDLWSLGVLLYEMACGTLPFKAATQAGTFDEILNKQPAAPSEINENIPVELENIIFKLLEKDRDFRYQTASDLLADLKRLRRSLGDLTSDSNETVKASTAEIRVPTQTETLTRSKFGARAGSKFWLRVTGVFVITAILGGIGYAVWNYFLPKPSGKGFESAVSSRMTNLGKVVDAVFSPDGKYIVYVTDDGAKQTLWLKQPATGSIIQIIAPSEDVYQGLAISPDNNWVYYNFWDRKSVGQVFRIPALGGTPQKIVHDCMPGISVSPDGAALTFVRSDDRNKRFALLTIGADGNNEREILSLPETFAHMPVFAPDGKTIAFGLFEGDIDKRYPQIAEIPATGGELKVIWKNTENTFQPNRFVWLPDKSGLLVTLNNSLEFQTQIWQIDYATGNLRQITKDLNSYGALSITADGKNLLAIEQDFLLSVWVVPIDNPSRAKRITDGKTEGIGLGWTPDNRIVYASNVGGNAEIWIMNEDGTGKKQLTSDKTPKLLPCVSGDGRYIFYSLVGNERGGSARMEIDGKNTKTLENSWNIACASAAPTVFHLAPIVNGHVALFRNSTELDSPVQITDKGLQDFTASPDGKSLAYIFWNEVKRVNEGEILSPADNSTKSFALPLSAVQKYSDRQFVLRWTADGKNLSFVNDENGFANIWLLPLNGEKPKRVTNFNDNFIFSFAWSADGKRLAVSRGTLTSDAILFKQN